MKILRNRYIAFCVAILFVAFSTALVAQQMGKLQFKQGAGLLDVMSGGQITVKSGGELEVESGGIIDVESGGYFKIAGTTVTSSAAELNLIDGSTAGTAVASKAAVLGTTKNLDSLRVDNVWLNKFTLLMSHRSDEADSAMVATLESGVPTLSFFGTDGDTCALTMNTNDQAVFSGVGGGFLFDGSTAITTAQLNVLAAVTPGTAAANKAVVLGESGEIDALTVTNLTATSFSGARAVQTVHQITAAADTFYSTGAYQVSGDAFYARPIAQKSTLFLESAVAGHWFDVFVADADSLRVVAASGDSIIIYDGTASRAISTVAGTCRIKAIDAVRWVIEQAVGTWTQDNGEQ